MTRLTTSDLFTIWRREYTDTPGLTSAMCDAFERKNKAIYASILRRRLKPVGNKRRLTSGALMKGA